MSGSATCQGVHALLESSQSPLGVENAEAIYGLPGVDAIFVGPNDLRAQMRKHLPGGRIPTVDEYEGEGLLCRWASNARSL